MAGTRGRWTVPALLAALVLGVSGWFAMRSPEAGGGSGGARAAAQGSGATGQAGRTAEAAGTAFLSPRPAGALADPLLVPGLRYAIDALLNDALEAGATEDLQEIKRRLRALADRHFAADVRERALALALRYVDYRAALGSVPPPADMSDAKAVRTAMQARDSLRQQFFQPAEYEALFAEEAALDRHTLARMDIAGDRTLTASQRADAMRAAEAALPEPLRAARHASVAHLAAADQTADLNARHADDATRYAERSARYGEAAAQALARRDEEDRQWQRRLDQYQQARAATGEGPALQQLRQQLFTPAERLRVDAALALRGAGG